MAVTASFIWSLISGSFDSPPFTIQFTDTSSGSPDYWLWDFGDNDSSSNQNPTHTYNSSGPFIVNLLAAVKNGAPNQLNGSVVTNLTKNSSILEFTNEEAYANFANNFFTTGSTYFKSLYMNNRDNSTFSYFARKLTYQFDLTSYSSSTDIATIISTTDLIPEGSDVLYFAAGTIKFSLSTGNSIIQLPSISESPRVAGDISSSLGSSVDITAQDLNYFMLPDPASYPWNNGAGWAISFIVEVQAFTSKDSAADNVPGTAMFSATPLNPQAGKDTVQFTDESTNSPTSWLWDFGDTNTSTDQNPTHQYTVDGTYDVKLTSTKSGIDDTIIRQDYIVVSEGLAALFSQDVSSGQVPLTVTFTDESTGAGIVSWAWTFGDTQISDKQNPDPVVYITPGQFTVTLTITDSEGVTDSIVKALEITAALPGFNATPRKAVESLNAVFATSGLDELPGTVVSVSFKRRPSNVNGSYVEFSTSETPTENFDIETPIP